MLILSACAALTSPCRSAIYSSTPSATLPQCVLTPACRTPRVVAYIRRVSTSAVNLVTDLLLQLEWPTWFPISPLLGRSTGTSARRIAFRPHRDHQMSISRLSDLLFLDIQICIEHVAYCGLAMPAVFYLRRTILLLSDATIAIRAYAR
jgi:hypothetical protein